MFRNYKILLLIILLLFVFLLFLFTERCASCENFESGDGEIIVTMTTIPERIRENVLPTTLSSLKSQSVQPHKIYINIPEKTKKGETYPMDKLKDMIKNYDNVEINYVPKDLGPITKIIPITKQINDNDNIIIVDDDVDYHKDVIKNLLNSKKEAVGFVGKYDNNSKWVSGEYYQGDVEFLETYAGVMYKGKVLKGLDEFNDTLQDTCKNQDDIIIGKYLKTKGVVPYVTKCQFVSSHDAKDTTELKTNNLSNGNQKCYSEIWDK